MTKHARAPRVPYGGPIAVKARNSSNETAQVQNLSEGGIYVVSETKYLVGTELLFYLPLNVGDRKSLCMVTGRVIRVDEKSPIPKKLGYGIQFDETLPKSSVQMLKDFVSYKQTGRIPERRSKTGRLNPNRD